MSLTTYAELQTAAGNWLDRSDLTARIPEFIALAEASLSRSLRTPSMLTRSEAFSIDGQYVAVPTGHQETKRLTLLTSPPQVLEFLTPEQISEERENGSGRPQYYTIVGGHYEFLPTPDSTYTASILYFANLTALSDSATTNWLLTAHPDAYLFGTLLEAEPYLKNDERVPMWRSRLDRVIAEINALGERQLTGQTPRARHRVYG